MAKMWVGVKMLCIDDSFSDEQTANCNALPVRGHVYTVRAIRIGLGEDNKRSAALMFEEIVNTRLIYCREPAFKLTRFRPDDSDAE